MPLFLIIIPTTCYENLFHDKAREDHEKSRKWPRQGDQSFCLSSGFEDSGTNLFITDCWLKKSNKSCVKRPFLKFSYIQPDHIHRELYWLTFRTMAMLHCLLFLTLRLFKIPLPDKYIYFSFNLFPHMENLQETN